MLSDDEQPHKNFSRVPQRIVPKWPFLAGDAVLVISALAVWSAAGTLSAGQVFFCLGAVVLGAIIFVAPYVLENFPSASRRFISDDSAVSDTDQASSTGVGEWGQQARAAAEAVEHAVRANAALESSARRFDARFAPLAEVHQSLAAVVAELREVATARETVATGEARAVQREFERLRKEQAEKFKLAEEKIIALSETLAVLTGQLKTLSVCPAPAGEPSETSAGVRSKGRIATPVEEPVAVRVEEAVLVGANVAVMDAPVATSSPEPVIAAVEVSIPEVPAVIGHVTAEVASTIANPLATSIAAVPTVQRVEPNEEQSMLAKALSRAQSSGQTPAVAGIIMARARRPRKSKSPIPVSNTPAETAVPTTPVETDGWSSLAEGRLDTVVAEDVSTEKAPQARTEPESGVVSINDSPSDDTSSAFRRSARAKIVALRGDEEEAAKKDTPVVFTPAMAGTSPAEPLSDGPTQGELLAREAETIRRKRSSRSPVSACALTARVLIGIGNKPFVRGTGPGLSAEKGTPMEFVEIGQWRWVAPNAVKEPITLRILKNDEVPAEGEAIVLHPGQALEVSPIFPA